MRANVAALRERGDAAGVLGKYEIVARLVTGLPDAPIDDGMKWVARLCADLQVPGLGSYGIGDDKIPEIVDKAARASSMKANPVALSEAELTGILERAL